MSDMQAPTVKIKKKEKKKKSNAQKERHSGGILVNLEVPTGNQLEE
jgi:hypothetical protein